MMTVTASGFLSHLGGRASLRQLAFACAALCTFALTVPQAEAGGRHHYRGYYGGVWVGDGAAVAGAVGLAAGAILGATLSSPRYYGGPVYYDPPPYRYAPPPYPAPPVVYAPPPYPYRSRAVVVPRSVQAGAPFSPEWIAYCARKYKSFNPRTGTYLAYSGKVRMCR
ncbi:BA14K family protein [Roseibium sp.]|uniref:BA14K family protein n=1 Tax=Roseibium sp. TaxID=1936156 RepID=UPI003A978800